MRIVFHKISDERHVLEIVRAEGSSERVECETRSYLAHDLLHYAVEREAKLETGFWGALAAGHTLAAMNDRSLPMGEMSADLAAIEQIVGALHAGTKGRPASELVAGLRRFAESLEQSLPSWVTESLVTRVVDHVRRLQGRWKATAYGEGMELDW